MARRSSEMLSVFRALQPRPGGDDPSDGGPGRRGIDFREWCREMVRHITETRVDLEECLSHLDKSLTELQPGDKKTEEAICEYTRMVAVDGETLHNYTKIFTLWSKRPAPKAAWDGDLARRTEDLMKTAADRVKSNPMARNCRERYEYMSQNLPEWCQNLPE